MAPAVVAIPVHNEAAVIETCLLSLAGQRPAGSFSVVVLLNNCTDATADIVTSLARTLPYPLHVHHIWLDAQCASAGMARHLAMEQAARLAGSGGILLTTDADARLPADWIARNRAHLDAGADAVAGMARIDPNDEAALPARLVADDAKATEFITLLDEIDWLLDPDETDAWPRHSEHSGASIATRTDWYARAGGMPAIPVGEDRRFFAQLRRVDARIRHPRDVVVTVSGRTNGRAKGGMADTIARRLRQPDPWLDDNCEPASHRARRAALRASVRDAWQTGWAAMTTLAAALQIPVAVLRRGLAAETFGIGWSDLEGASPVLRRHAVAAAHVDREIATARRIVERLRQTALSVQAHPGGTGRFASAM